MEKKYKKDLLDIRIFDTRKEMGKAAADDVAAEIKTLLAEKPEVNMIFAAAPSQNEFLEALVGHKEIAWNRINGFHMDEYVGVDAAVKQSFVHFLHEAIFDKLPFKKVYCLNGKNEPEAECVRYSKLLKEFPVDIVCMGIGENGHVAFNDPPVADFKDPKLVKIVALDPVCREQQVHDGCFATLDDVFTHAFTLTVPALMSAKYLNCIVPAATKAQAVERTVNGPIRESCPASILREQPHAVLYLDKDSSSKLS